MKQVDSENVFTIHVDFEFIEVLIMALKSDTSSHLRHGGPFLIQMRFQRSSLVLW
jgi:hypothetical protein